MGKAITDPTELIGRHITQKSYYRSGDGTVKHNAFMPNKNGETSVYQINGLSNEEVWEIGDRFVGAIIGRHILGHAEIPSGSILSKSLSIIPKPKPHPLHADIMNWPESSSEKKALAIKLAAEASLKLRKAV
ncbi:MAG: hypothetical protein Q9M31_06795 [Mariprofundus sp.]|nr:hypothetical protein [Mariprofundus sp.]